MVLSKGVQLLWKPSFLPCPPASALGMGCPALCGGQMGFHARRRNARAVMLWSAGPELGPPGDVTVTCSVALYKYELLLRPQFPHL